MAWRSHGTSNSTLVSHLRQNALLSSPRTFAAMLATDRAHFVPDPTAAYRDSPQSIGHGATISAPHMHAAAAEALEEFCRPGGRVLDVGSGSGYFTSLVGGLVLGGVGAGAGGGGLGGAPAAAADAGGTTTTSPPPLAADDDAGTTAGGLVVGIEHIEALREMGERNVMKSEIGREWVRSGRMRFVKGDGRMGWREGAPWDAIHVGAAAAGFQQELVDQLKAPGRLFIPVEVDSEQHIYIIDKDAQGNVTTKREYGVRYVPLTDAPE